MTDKRTDETRKAEMDAALDDELKKGEVGPTAKLVAIDGVATPLSGSEYVELLALLGRLRTTP